MAEEDEIKAKVYNIFYKENKNLFKEDRQEFIRQQREYVEREYTNIKYNLKEENAS